MLLKKRVNLETTFNSEINNNLGCKFQTSAFISRQDNMKHPWSTEAAKNFF